MNLALPELSPGTFPTFENRRRWQQRPHADPVMRHRWRNLLFLHWRCEPEVIQSCLPAGLTVDTFDGSAWMAIVPFEMRRIRPCWSPIVPYISNFLELNLRTYVVDRQGTPGVWFVSLNTNRLLAVALGRGWFRLPYFWCGMRSRTDKSGWTDYSWWRFHGSDQKVHQLRYRPHGQPAPAKDETLEFFLVERYVLFTTLSDGRLASGQVHHVPYPVQPVDVAIWDDRQFTIDGYPRPGRPPDHALFSSGVDVEVFGLEPMNGSP